MAVSRLAVVPGLLLATLLVVAAPSFAQAEECLPGAGCVLDDQTDSAPGVDPEEQQTNVDPTKPDDVTGGLEDNFNNLPSDGGSTDNVGRGLWGPGEFGDIGPAVVETLAENWILTALVTFGMAGTAVAGWLLASRYIDPKVALRSPERSMLYGFVKGNPGVHLKQLSTEFEMKTSTVLWHVRKLEAADLVRSKKANGYRVFYPVSGGLEASRISEAVTTLSNPNARTIFAHIVQNTGATLRALPERLSINAGTIRWHVKKLRQAGLIEDAPEGRGATRVTELGAKAWNQVQGIPQTFEVPLVPISAETVQEEAPLYSS